ncbi:hypothetical protein [Streptomyces bobili]|uniref:hypothetical protein n=1 Tax=Streptomyces bobili TaxID=67280 RepID=UPI0037B87C62
MICDRCDKPITGKPDTYDHVSSSAGGITLYFCPGYCKVAPRQRTSEPPVVLPESPRSRQSRRRRR